VNDMQQRFDPSNSKSNTNCLKWASVGCFCQHKDNSDKDVGQSSFNNHSRRISSTRQGEEPEQ
jgi:hypothetical protein